MYQMWRVTLVSSLHVPHVAYLLSGIHRGARPDNYALLSVLVALLGCEEQVASPPRAREILALARARA